MSAVTGVSYWGIVRRQLAKNRLAMFGLRCVVGLLLVATYAPVIASDRPFFVSEPEGVRWPWFAQLFDRVSVRQPVDLFFNLLMLGLPAFALVFGLARWRMRRVGTWSAQRARRIVGVASLVFVWTFFGVYLPDSVMNRGWAKVLFAPGAVLRTSVPYVDYHLWLADRRREGTDATAVFPPVPYSYSSTRPAEGAMRPDWFVRGPERKVDAVGPHPLGTDPGGIDVFTTLLYGTRISMTIGVLAVAIYVTIGVILGSLAGYFGGKVDMFISRFVEIMICFPTLFFVLTIVSVFETRSIFLVMVAIGLSAWTGVSRLVRGEFLTQRGLEYAVAATALGIPQRRIIFRHILPNALTPVLVAATFGIAAAILTESSISFLGLGDPKAASWGNLLRIGRQSNLDWLILAPGAAIFFTVTVFNLLGEGLRDALDPKLRQ